MIIIMTLGIRWRSNKMENQQEKCEKILREIIELAIDRKWQEDAHGLFDLLESIEKLGWKALE